MRAILREIPLTLFGLYDWDFFNLIWSEPLKKLLLLQEEEIEQYDFRFDEDDSDIWLKKCSECTAVLDGDIHVHKGIELLLAHIKCRGRERRKMERGEGEYL
jgi:hypothetical protein